MSRRDLRERVHTCGVRRARRRDAVHTITRTARWCSRSSGRRPPSEPSKSCTGFAGLRTIGNAGPRVDGSSASRRWWQVRGLGRRSARRRRPSTDPVRAVVALGVVVRFLALMLAAAALWAATWWPSAVPGGRCEERQSRRRAARRATRRSSRSSRARAAASGQALPLRHAVCRRRRDRPRNAQRSCDAAGGHPRRRLTGRDRRRGATRPAPKFYVHLPLRRDAGSAARRRPRSRGAIASP